MKATVYFSNGKIIYKLVEQIHQDNDGSIWIQYISLSDSLSKLDRLPDDTNKIMLSYDD